MTGRLETNADQGVNLLLWLLPDGPLYLEHMESEGQVKPKARRYAAHEAASAKRFVTANNAPDLRRNVYFLLNATFLSGSRAKANLSAALGLHVDLDCKDYPGSEDQQRDTILGMLGEHKLRPKGVPRPTAFWFTGGGYQAVWLLAEPVTVEEAETMNRALLAAFGGAPGPVDASRLLRLPGSVNWLNDKKREAGRSPAAAMLLEPVNFNAPPVRQTVADFSLRPAKATALAVSTRSGKTVEPSSLEPLPLPDDLSEVLPSDFGWVEAIVNGSNPPGKSYPSRSELVFAAVIWMLGHGVAPGHVLSVITDAALSVSAHVREQPNPLRYAQRQVARAMEMIETRHTGWPHTDDGGNPISSHPDNVRFALATLGVDARRNLFVNADEITGQGLDDRDLNDIGEILSSLFQRRLHFKASQSAVKRELIAIAHEQAFHPVLDYLDGLAWDGTARIDTWLRDYCGADDNPLNREFAARLLIAGVRRIRQPGVKFDTMLVLEGAQGAGKSRLAARLAVREEWFCGSLDLGADAKTQAEILARAWIVECPELDGARKADLDKIKQFLSTPIDVYRRAYGRDAGSYARHCIIIGTTNEDAYLRDPTGNRRFWPVRVGSIDFDRFGADVDQLWAEAVVREAAGESIILSPELWQAAEAVQQIRMVEDPFVVPLEGAFGERTGRVSLDSVKLLLGYEGGRMSPGEAQRVRRAMNRLDWDEGTHRLHDLGRTERFQRRGFGRGTPEERKVEWIARRTDVGAVTLVQADSELDDETPF